MGLDSCFRRNDKGGAGMTSSSFVPEIATGCALTTTSSDCHVAALLTMTGGGPLYEAGEKKKIHHIPLHCVQGFGSPE